MPKKNVVYPINETQLATETQRLLDSSGPWIGIRDASRVLECPPQTLYSACRSGRLPSLKFGPVGGSGYPVYLVRLDAVKARVGLTAGRGKYTRKPRPTVAD